MIRAAALGVCLALAGPALAFEPDLPPGARALSERVSEAGYDLPAGPWTDDGIETLRITGAIVRRTWRLDGQLSTQMIVEPLVAQAEAAGYAPVFACQDRDCGGFDFRFGIDVVPGPDMFVDLADFRFVSAMNADGDALSLLVSAGRGGAWLQIAEVTRAAPSRPEDMVRVLLDAGRMVLQPLSESAPEGTPNPALEAMAELLGDRADLRLALVAHTAGADHAQDAPTAELEARELGDRVVLVFVVDVCALNRFGKS